MKEPLLKTQKTNAVGENCSRSKCVPMRFSQERQGRLGPWFSCRHLELVRGSLMCYTNSGVCFAVQLARLRVGSSKNCSVLPPVGQHFGTL